MCTSVPRLNRLYSEKLGAKGVLPQLQIAQNRIGPEYLLQRLGSIVSSQVVRQVQVVSAALVLSSSNISRALLDPIFCSVTGIVPVAYRPVT